LQDNFPSLEFVDFGGGFKVPYHPDEHAYDYSEFGRVLGEIFSEFCAAYGRELLMFFEPGKYIVAESGSLLVRVTTLKDNRGRLIAGTDSGFPQLIRPMFYGAYHHIVNLSNRNAEPRAYDICGNICETGDNFATERPIAEIREGDILQIQNAGAYCYSMGGVYNLRPMPAELLWHNNQATLARRRLSPAELVALIVNES
jgi:diaminopimelate decarboxylase